MACGRSFICRRSGSPSARCAASLRNFVPCSTPGNPAPCFPRCPCARLPRNRYRPCPRNLSHPHARQHALRPRATAARVPNPRPRNPRARARRAYAPCRDQPPRHFHARSPVSRRPLRKKIPFWPLRLCTPKLLRYSNEMIIPEFIEPVPVMADPGADHDGLRPKRVPGYSRLTFLLRVSVPLAKRVVNPPFFLPSPLKPDPQRTETAPDTPQHKPYARPQPVPPRSTRAPGTPPAPNSTAPHYR
jgi:hypothetical protein